MAAKANGNVRIAMEQDMHALFALEDMLKRPDGLIVKIVVVLVIASTATIISVQNVKGAAR